MLRIFPIHRRITIARFRVYTQPSRNNSKAAAESSNVAHSTFLAEAPPRAKWKSDDMQDENEQHSQDLDDIAEGKGKLLTTSSHLLKLIIPLSHAINTSRRAQARLKGNADDYQRTSSKLPIVILLHPSQPLSHVARLIASSFLPASPEISFQSEISSALESKVDLVTSRSRNGRQYQWSDSTDIGDFIKDAAHAAKFSICIRHAPEESTIITVSIPTFADRTRFIQRRLDDVNSRLNSMEALKKECDVQAHRGAKRMALGGFGMLVVYWGTVARLTFVDYGWEVMEPVTYLSGLSTVMCGYLWFLYRGREVSYSSVLNSSISVRREGLYRARGFDIEEWVDLIAERKKLSKEIEKIKDDYSYDEDEDSEVDEDKIKESADPEDGPSEKEKRTKEKIEEVTKKDMESQSN